VTDTGGASFDEMHRVFSLFGQAIADRALALEPVDGAPLTGRTRVVGERILVPSGETDRRAARVGVMHQIGYLIFGTDAVDISALAPVVRQLFFAFEDLRVDAALARQYPGVRTDLDRIRREALRDRPHQSERIVDAIERCSLGWMPNDPAPVVTLAVRLTDDFHDPSATAFDSLRVAQAIVVALEEAADDEGWVTAIALDDESSPDAPSGNFAVETADGEVQTSDDFMAGGGMEVRGELDIDRDMQQDSDGRGSAQPQPLNAATIGDQTEVEEGEAATPERARLARSRPSSVAGERIYLYDEWDHLNQTYLRSWCQVKEQRLRGDDFGFIGEVRRRHAVLASHVKRRFAFARSEGWHRVHRTRDGDELEIDAVIESIVDKRAGGSMDDRLYVRRDRAVREVATAFLVDLSASTSSPIEDDPPAPKVDEPEGFEYRFVTYDDFEHPPVVPTRKVIDIAKESLALMCDALQVLGDRHAMYGFSGQGRADVEFQIAKDFGDAVSMRTWAALAAMAPRRYTRMGPAIRHATTKLQAQAVRTKLLIVLSDGYPQDIDYGPVRGDKEYGLQDTARALREAEDLGIQTFCVTIDPAGHDYLRRMCPESHYLVIDDVKALPDELTKLYRALTSFSPTSRIKRSA
jgi:nitric oxide reductase NorD protein